MSPCWHFRWTLAVKLSHLATTIVRGKNIYYQLRRRWVSRATSSLYCSRTRTKHGVCSVCLSGLTHLRIGKIYGRILTHCGLAGFYIKGRPLVKSNLICPSDKLSWQPGCPVLNINIKGNFCISQGNGSSDNLPSDAICQQRSVLILAQVFAWCLSVPSHYPNQCWTVYIPNDVRWRGLIRLLTQCLANETVDNTVCFFDSGTNSGGCGCNFICIISRHLSDWCCEHFQWNNPHVNVTESHW